MTKVDDLSKRTITIKRTFKAPRSLVWEAWTKPEHIVNWWGQKGMEIKIVEHNFKVGGKWNYVMQMPNGNEFISEGEYLEILEPEKVFTTANFRPMTEGIEIQATFDENGDKTNLTFKCIHPTEEYCKQQEKMGIYKGWGAVFDRLESHLAEM